MQQVIEFLPRLFEGGVVTIYIFSVVALASLAAGLATAVAAHYLFPPLLLPMKVYGWAFRALPELIVLLACYLGLPQLGISSSPVSSAILGLTLVRIAYDFELFRGALASVQEAQVEASRALGIPFTTMIRRIIIPQMARIALGPWITQSCSALKGVSIASAVAVTEIMQVTRQGIIATGHAFEFILVAAGMYAVLSSALMLAELVIARRTDRGFA